MRRKEADEWANEPLKKRVLMAFSSPSTPTQIEQELGIKKLKILPFLTKGLLKCLNEGARKGRFYIITARAAQLTGLPYSRKGIHHDWRLIGKIGASPKQKLAILLTLDERKRTSEEIRLRTAQRNPHLTRISTKSILAELLKEKLAASALIERKRYYWLTELGMKIKNQITDDFLGTSRITPSKFPSSAGLYPSSKELSRLPSGSLPAG